MDTVLFQEDWDGLSQDLLCSIEQKYGSAYREILNHATLHIQSHPDDIETLMAAFDYLSNEDLKIIMRALGLLIEIFSILQHVHKTHEFYEQEKITKDLSDHAYELDLFISIQQHETISPKIQDILNQWTDILMAHRHHENTSIPFEIHSLIVEDCKKIFDEDHFMQMQNIYDSYKDLMKNYTQHTHQGILKLQNRLSTITLAERVKIGFVIRADFFDPDFLNIFQNVVSMHASQKSSDSSFAQYTSLYGKISASICVEFLEYVVEKKYQKRLIRIFDDKDEFEQILSTITMEVLSNRQILFPAHLQAFFQWIVSIRTNFEQKLEGVIIADITNFYQLNVVHIFVHSIAQLPLVIIPSFESPSAIEQCTQWMKNLYASCKKTEKAFCISKIIIGNQNHNQYKSFWWMHTQMYHIQSDLMEWAREHQWNLKIIQSRGGSLSRGSMPTRCLIGSTLFNKKAPYLGLVIHRDAFRQRFMSSASTEMTIFRYIMAIMDSTNNYHITSEQYHLQKSFAEHSLSEVVFYTQEQPDLIDYFYAVTPAENLSSQSLVSIKDRHIETMNSTIWFGSWSQSRLLLPFWLGLGAVLLQWDKSDMSVKEDMKSDRCIQSLFLITLISLYRVNISILRAYEKELLSHDLSEVGEHLQQRHAAVIDLTEKFVDYYKEDIYVKNFKDDMIYRSRYLTPLHCLQIQMLRRSRSQWPTQKFWKSLIRESMMFISLGLQNSV
jgi:phosphoenolpyruvate carboxylase